MRLSKTTLFDLDLIDQIALYMNETKSTNWHDAVNALIKYGFKAWEELQPRGEVK